MKIVTDNLTAFYVKNELWVSKAREYFREKNIKIIRPISCNGITYCDMVPNTAPILTEFCKENNIELIVVPMGTVYFKGPKYKKLLELMNE
mgnify:CR=1 FL=1